MPGNCAYGILNTVYNAANFDNTNADLNKTALICLQCKPGYKPTYLTLANNTFDGKIVTKCDPI